MQNFGNLQVSLKSAQAVCNKIHLRIKIKFLFLLKIYSPILQSTGCSLTIFFQSLPSLEREGEIGGLVWGLLEIAKQVIIHQLIRHKEELECLFFNLKGQSRNKAKRNRFRPETLPSPMPTHVFEQTTALLLTKKYQASYLASTWFVFPP